MLKLTFFEDRAQVRRSQRFQVQQGRSTLVWSELSPVLDDASVQVRCLLPDVQVLATRIKRQVCSQEESVSERCLRELRNCEAECRQVAGELEVVQVRARELSALFPQWLGALLQSGRVEPEVWDEDYGQLVAEWEQTLAHQLDLERRQSELHEELASRRLRAEAVREPRHEARLEILVESPRQGEAEFQLSYRTPCALWRPEHTARLADGQVELSMVGVLWQNTGETWQQAQAELSTARPSQPAAAPALRDDVLTLRPKTEEEKKNVLVAVREQAIGDAGLGAGEMPGVDDGGEVLCFALGEPADLPSDGRPVRVPIATTTLPCAVTRIAYPELSEGVYVRARLNHDGFGRGWPLLAGPARLTSGQVLVGRAGVDLVMPGEIFELGFGLDDRLRVRRAQQVQRETVPVIGTQKLTFSVTVTVSNLSNETVTLLVRERIPVSELPDLIKVVWLQPRELQPDDDGFLEWPLEMAPNSHREVQLEYRVEASARVRLPW